MKSAFGGSLYQQGRGFYTSLELLAIVRGSILLQEREKDNGVEGPERLLPNPSDPATFLKPTHDFARRLMAGVFQPDDLPAEVAWLAEGDTEHVLRSLLVGLHCPVPGRRREPADWRKWHIYPFPPEFAHYDALTRGRGSKARIEPERDSYRGGGGLFHKWLRCDPNTDRLHQTREGLRILMSSSESALAELASSFQNLDASKPGTPFKDPTEEKATVIDSPWVEIAREGTNRLLTRTDLPDFKRVEALMYWVPFCLARHVQSCAESIVHDLDPADSLVRTVFECRAEPGPIRNLAKDHLRRTVNSIYEALGRKAEEEGHTDLLAGSQNWRLGPRTFFTTTCFAVGALNAPTGAQHFALNPALLESLVVAMVDSEVTLGTFCQSILCDRLGIVVSARAARAVGIEEVDSAPFHANQSSLEDTLHELGLLVRYSDATQMVGMVVR